MSYLLAVLFLVNILKIDAVAGEDTLKTGVQDFIDTTFSPVYAGLHPMDTSKHTDRNDKPCELCQFTKNVLNSPIIPTVEEKLFMSNNMPVTIPYLVRPEQMLLLMMHE